tara:strand:+ start:7587 stop:8075 length:489 start_codon:yes stop_codon:yes gene_type:complete
MQEPPLTPEAKAALMQFVGQTYGAMNKQDQMIVGQSSSLQPGSSQLKQTFESVAKMPTVQRPQQAPLQQAPPQESQPAEAPQQVAPIPPAQAAQELKEAQQQQAAMAVQQVSQVDNNQLDLDFSEPSKVDKMLKLLEKQNLLLKEISLKLDNGKTAKANKQK